MTKSIKNTASILLLVILLGPLVIKLAHSAFHEHDHFVCKAKHEHHFHEDHEKCPVCSYEFSIYLSQKIVHYHNPDETTDCYRNLYRSTFFIRFPKYAFLLRAPPVDSCLSD